MSELFGGNPTEPDTQPAAEQPVPQATEQTPEPIPPVDPYADLLKTITAEDGRQKYGDVKTALESIPHAQGRITELSQRVRELEDNLAKSKGVEEMLTHLQSSQQPVADAPAASPGVDDIEAVVAKAIEKRQLAEQRTANQNRVVSALTEMYGENAETKFKERAAELGVSEAYLTEQAFTYPDFVLQQFKADAKPTSAIKPSVATSAMSPQPVQHQPVMRGATSKQTVDAYRAHANIKK